MKMGIEWYIADKSNKTFYCLGRGNWFCLKDDFEALIDKEYLAHYILSEVYNPDNIDDELSDYVNSRISFDLHTHFGSTSKEFLMIINDSTDDLYIIRCKGYRCVGTRYGEIGSKDYEEDMKFLNRHLDENNHPSGFYDSKHATGIPNWSDW